MELSLLFFAVSGVYASAGFAGGSSFLAALTIAGIPAATAAQAALLCNIASASSVLLYARQCREILSDCFWILASGALAAAFGAGIRLSGPWFAAFLSVCLLAAAWSLFARPSGEIKARPIPKLLQIIMGIAAGGFGGATGIGGGVLLAVLLHFLFKNGMEQRRVSLLTALFILLNSVTGLLVRMVSQTSWTLPLPGLEMLVLSAFLGGLVGRVVSQNLRERSLRRVTALAVAAPIVAFAWSFL